jgi:RNA polymerase sigma factor (sigma-70 family)
VLPASGVRELPFAERYSSDERLARLVARGSTRAFAVLYERHHGALARYCRSIVGNDDDAQDAMQSAMASALAALQASERELRVRAWLFRIVHNEAISLLRRKRSSAPIDESIPAAYGVEQALEQRERLATLVADLWTLTERQRSVLLMRELAGLSLSEIAGAQSLSPGAAKQALFEARCALHELVAGRGMACEAVRHSVVEHDGRVLRGRKLRAHLRVCGECRDFRASTELLSGELRMLIPPLPFATAGLVVARLSGTTGGQSAGFAAVGGGHAAGSFAVKLLAGATLMTAAVDGSLHVTAPPHHAARGAAVVTSTRVAAIGMPTTVTAHARPVALVRRKTTTTTPHPPRTPRLVPTDPAVAPQAPVGTDAPTTTSVPTPVASAPATPSERTDVVMTAAATSPPAPPAASAAGNALGPVSDLPPRNAGASSPGPPADPHPDHGAASNGDGNPHDGGGNGQGNGKGSGNGNDGNGNGHGNK